MIAGRGGRGKRRDVAHYNAQGTRRPLFRGPSRLAEGSIRHGLSSEGHAAPPGRLRSFDYATPGAYFITVCSWNRQEILGEVMDEGVIAQRRGAHRGRDPVGSPRALSRDRVRRVCRHAEPCTRNLILEVVGAGLRPAPTDPTGSDAQRHALPEIVRAFKSFSARGINELRRTPGHPVWQRGYYDHVIREEQDLKRIRDYISSNPLAWSTDRQNPLQSGSDPFEDWLAKQGRIPALKSGP